MAQEVREQSDLKNDDATLEGKIIQKHLERINMDAWYYIYQFYVQSKEKE